MTSGPTGAGGSRRYVIAGQEYSREEIIHRYLHLVKYVAGRISVGLPPNVELSDLINDGVVGLIDAIEKYDDGRGVKFETYAITRIHGAILDALRALDWVPRAVRQRARELERVSHELETTLGRAPTDEEVASRMGISSKEHDTLLQRIRATSVLSLEERLPSDRGQDIPLRDLLRAGEDDIGASVERSELREQLTDAVFALPRAERTVVVQYYFEGRTLKQIKGELGVSESRVSQIHAQAVARLRKLLREMRADLGYRETDPGVRRKGGNKTGAPGTEKAIGSTG
jgi:RNA polymerase sigma factor for flagellar operon FliA